MTRGEVSLCHSTGKSAYVTQQGFFFVLFILISRGGGQLILLKKKVLHKFFDFKSNGAYQTGIFHAMKYHKNLKGKIDLGQGANLFAMNEDF